MTVILWTRNCAKPQGGTDSAHKKNRQQSQDGRIFRHYRLRWIVCAGKPECLFAWPHNFRCMVTRWEYHHDNFFGMVQLAYVLIPVKEHL
jgi:hypothetical protein